MQEVLPLRLLPSGRAGHVSQVLGDTESVRRLAELGMAQGARVEMLQRGSPCIVRLDGGRLCFRDGELLNVLVQTERSA